MRTSDSTKSAKLTRPIGLQISHTKVSLVALVEVLFLFATCCGTLASAQGNKIETIQDKGTSWAKQAFGLTKLQHEVTNMLKHQPQVSDQGVGTNNQVSINNITQGLVPNSPVNVWYCSNNPGTGIQFSSVEIEDYPIQKGITAYYEFQGIGRYSFRLAGVVVILSIPQTGAQVMQISVGDPYSVHQGYLVDYWFGLQFPNYVPPGSYNVNFLFIDVYGSIRECIYFPTRF